ncbi:glycosyltransferase [Marinicellulosiphila megalodicopiae]|uniref:glycosyltransferase n=1 Tax=Marinicellulosiphila megalodicopiae TaxID=2724896 RepID=UPI003BAE45BA
MKALLIAKHWPEPNATAAGRRTFDILNVLSNFEIHAACGGAISEHCERLEQQNISCYQIKLNDQSFNDFIQDLNPDLVIYDRFMIEEQFSWRVRQTCPNAMTILDTSDLHSLRYARHVALNSAQELNLNNDIALREIASIQRTDLTLMISSVEMRILQEHFKIDSNKIHYFPFVIDCDAIEPELPNFEQRANVMMIGNFLHEPNWDAARFAVQSIWPLVRKQLPQLELHIYGAYSSDKHQQLHQPKLGIHLKGHCENALSTFKQYRINLAPLRFGAGQKGKVLEGWLTGTATIGSPIALESMTFDEDLGYRPSIEPKQIARQIQAAYSDSNYFNQLVDSGFTQLTNHFDNKEHSPALKIKITEHLTHLELNRANDFYQQLLWQKQFRAEQYLSKWIEEKNK